MIAIKWIFWTFDVILGLYILRLDDIKMCNKYVRMELGGKGGAERLLLLRSIQLGCITWLIPSIVRRQWKTSRLDLGRTSKWIVMTKLSRIPNVPFWYPTCWPRQRWKRCNKGPFPYLIDWVVHQSDELMAIGNTDRLSHNRGLFNLPNL